MGPLLSLVKMDALPPGIYYDIEAAAYHADPCETPSLSSSVASILLKKTPRHAQHAHPRLNPLFKKEVTSNAMDLGSVTHEILLGCGGAFEVCPFDDYRTRKAQEWREVVVLNGKIPIKALDLDAAKSMAESVRSILPGIPGAERAIIEGHGEAVAIWRDYLGPLCRARIDWLDLAGGVVYDLKTTRTGLGDRHLNARIAGEFEAFDMRAAFYVRGVEQLIEADPAARRVLCPDVDCLSYRWIFVESEAPFEARVFEMDATTRANGDRKATAAILLWQQCLTENRWPGYARRIERPECPEWALEDMHL